MFYENESHFIQSAKRDKAMQAYLKFKGPWQKMASAQALCLNGLGESDLLQMTDKPTQLIQRLYEHPSITTATWASSDEKPGTGLTLHVWHCKSGEHGTSLN